MGGLEPFGERAVEAHQQRALAGLARCREEPIGNRRLAAAGGAKHPQPKRAHLDAGQRVGKSARSPRQRAVARRHMGVDVGHEVKRLLEEAVDALPGRRLGS